MPITMRSSRSEGGYRRTAGIDMAALARQEGLTAEQLKELATSPLVTIGAHTERHSTLRARRSTQKSSGKW